MGLLKEGEWGNGLEKPMPFYFHTPRKELLSFKNNPLCHTMTQLGNGPSFGSICSPSLSNRLVFSSTAFPMGSWDMQWMSRSRSPDPHRTTELFSCPSSDPRFVPVMVMVMQSRFPSFRKDMGGHFDCFCFLLSLCKYWFILPVFFSATSFMCFLSSLPSCRPTLLPDWLPPEH